MSRRQVVRVAVLCTVALYLFATAQPAMAAPRTRLLFPFVSNVAGFDTGWSISNTADDPFGTVGQTGYCKLYFYGTGAPAPHVTFAIAPGQTYTDLASNRAPGFQGYMIAVCQFRYAHGFGMVSDIGARNVISSYLPLVIDNPRDTGSESLGE